ncbi:MAG: hypothetical protein IJ061_00730 [Lachnospiraceae bacterium]|nr:hypothetical protein [Lachnospiraceae bacterium]
MKKIARKMTAVLLSFSLTLSLMPVQVFAEPGAAGAGAAASAVTEEMTGSAAETAGTIAASDNTSGTPAEQDTAVAAEDKSGTFSGQGTGAASVPDGTGMSGVAEVLSETDANVSDGDLQTAAGADMDVQGAGDASGSENDRNAGVAAADSADASESVAADPADASGTVTTESPDSSETSEADSGSEEIRPSASLRNLRADKPNTATPSNLRAAPLRGASTESHWLYLRMYYHESGSGGETGYYETDLLADPFVENFEAPQAALDSISGYVSYDESSNTIWLTDFYTTLPKYTDASSMTDETYVELSLEMSEMGDMKLMVEGDCVISKLECYDGTLTIDGPQGSEGFHSLLVNISGSERYSGNVVYLEGAASRLTVGPNLWFKALGGFTEEGGWGSGPVNVNGTALTDGLVIQGELEEGQVVRKEYESGRYRFAVSEDAGFDNRMAHVAVKPSGAGQTTPQSFAYTNRPVTVKFPQELLDELGFFSGTWYLEATPVPEGGGTAGTDPAETDEEKLAAKTTIIEQKYYNGQIPEEWYFYTVSMGQAEWSRLSLTTEVGGKRKEIAYYDASAAPLKAEDVPEGGMTVTMTKADGFARVDGIVLKDAVDGSVIDEAEYYTSLSGGAGDQFLLPALMNTDDPSGITGLSLKAYPYSRWGGDAYYKYIWSNQSDTSVSLTGGIEENKLVAEISRRPEKVTVSGTVYYGEGADAVPAAGALVTIHQSLEGTAAATGETGGLDYNVTVEAGQDGSYAAEIWSGVNDVTRADFAVRWNRVPMGITDTYLYEDITGDTVHDLHIRSDSFAVQLKIAGMDETDPGLLGRYLNAASKRGIDRNWYVRTETPRRDGSGTWWGGSFGGVISLEQMETSSFRSGGGSGTRIYADGAMLAEPADPASAAVTVPEGQSLAVLNAELKAGAVAELSLGTDETTTGYTVMWYDAGGDYAASDTVVVTRVKEDFAFMRKDGMPEGSYTGVLAPSNQSFCYRYDRLGDQDPALKRISVDFTDGVLTDLGSIVLSSSDYENGVYVTQPNSSMSVNRDSFGSLSDLIAVTGHIGLDANLGRGSLSAIKIYTGKTSSDPVATAVLDSFYVNGNEYVLEEWGEDNWNQTRVANAGDIGLPADFTLYLKPSDLARDIELDISVDAVTGDGIFYNQKVGSVRVSRPGASIASFSTYVASDSVRVFGGALPDETVMLYDGDIPVGSALADRFGKWNAELTLANTWTGFSVHELRAEGTESGISSESVTVRHHPEAPEVRRFLMSWSNYGTTTIPVGESYVFEHWMNNVRFTADILNPGSMRDLSEAGFDSGVKALFKVWTMDGQVRFINASQKAANADGTTRFESAEGFNTAMPVTRAEVLMLPKNFSEEDPLSLELQLDDESFYSDSGLQNVTAADVAAFKESLQDIGSVRISASAGSSGNEALLSYITEKQGAGSDEAKAAKEYTEILDDFGLDLAYMNVSHSEQSTLEWFESLRAGQYPAIYERNLVFESGAELQSDLAEMAAGGSYAKISAADGTTMYAVSRSDPDDSGNETFSAVFNYYESPGSGLYTVQARVMILPSYRGGSGVSMLASAGIRPHVRLTTGEGEGSVPNVNAVTTGVNYLNGGSHDSYGADVDKINDDTGGMSLMMGMIGAVNEAIWAGAMSGSLGASIRNGAGNVCTWLGAAATIVNMFFTFYDSAMKSTAYSEMKKNWENLLHSPCVNFPALLGDAQMYRLQRAFERKLEKARKLKKGVVGWCQWLNTGALGCCFFGPVGAAGGGMLGSISFAIGRIGGDYLYKAEMELQEAYCDLMNYTKLRIRNESLWIDRPECNGKNDTGTNTDSVAGANTPHTIDPSGIVYEAVIENPVAGAVVSIYEGGSGDGNLATGYASVMTPADPVQTTGSDGRYSWLVPAGNWHVKAQKGSLTGDSSADKEATAAGNLLPVPPPQLDVNIPLVDAVLRPAVQEAIFTTQGVYLIFTKYMNEDDITNYAANYKLSYGTDGTGAEIPITGAEVRQQGHAAPNRTDNAAETYSKAVYLKTGTLNVGEKVTLQLDLDGDETGNDLNSYAGRPVLAAVIPGEVAEEETCEPPTFEPAGGKTAYSTIVEISVDSPNDAEVWYLVVDADDTATAEAGFDESTWTKLGTGNGSSGTGASVAGTITIYNNCRVLAIARRTGRKDSRIAEAVYTVSGEEPVTPDTPSTPSGPVTPSTPSNPAKPVTPADADTIVSPASPSGGGHSDYDSSGESNAMMSSRNRTGGSYGAGGRTSTSSLTGGVWERNADGSWSYRMNGGGLATGWQFIGGASGARWYVFDGEGRMLTGWYLDTDGKWYYLCEEKDGSEGAMLTGWHLDPQDGYLYYLKPETGEMAIGWYKVGSKWYFFNPVPPAPTWEQDGAGRWVYKGNTASASGAGGGSGAAGRPRPYGSMYCDEITPDGFRVDASGAWTE